MENPYSAPGSPLQSDSSSFGVSPAVIQALGGTKPWVRLCSVIGFILAGFMIILALFMLLAGGAMFAGAAGGGSSPTPGPPAALVGIMPVVMAIMYLVIAAFYLFPSIKLWKYGSNILRLMQSQSMADLEAALDCQRSFWKFVGIMICVTIALYLLAIIVGVIGLAAVGSSVSP